MTQQIQKLKSLELKDVRNPNDGNKKWRKRWNGNGLNDRSIKSRKSFALNEWKNW